MIGYMDRTASAVEHCESMVAQLQARIGGGTATTQGGTSSSSADQTTTTPIAVIVQAYEKLAEYCKLKLWHQLTLLILEMLQHPNIYAAISSSSSTSATSSAASAQQPSQLSGTSASSSSTTITDQGGTHSFLALYDKVVLCVDSKLNPLSMAKIAALVAQAIQPLDATAAKAILENLISNLSKNKEKLSSSSLTEGGGGNSNSNEIAIHNNRVLTTLATIYVQSKLASLVLTSTVNLATEETSPTITPTTALDSASSMSLSLDSFPAIVRTLQSNKDILHEFPAEGNTELASVHAAHYEAAMHYYKRLGPPESFYEQALSYLQHVGPDYLESATTAEATTSTTTPSIEPSTAVTPTGGGGIGIPPHQLAVDLILAALTGEGVYNLGQVEQTPVLKLLLGTTYEWLVHLLQATAAGNVTLFRQYQQQYATQIAQQPALVHRAAAVVEKLTLLSLVTLLFTKPPQERQLSFQEIATTLQLESTSTTDSSSALDQVEWIIMRALSVHLIEGTIDQVNEIVNITWVMPRVLSIEQMQQLANRFGEWAVTVSQTQESVTLATMA